MKGISPLIASVLLIAFTVAVGGILSIWLVGFTTTNTNIISEQTTDELECSYAAVSIRNLRYNTTSSNITGMVENTKWRTIGNVSILILYKNQTSYKLRLNDTAGNRLTLDPRDTYSFSITTASNYDKIRVMTNCSSVYDEASSSDVA
jgi:flagellin-like protein